jgi:hypothetical protein
MFYEALKLLVDILNTYSNLIIAIFTIVAATIAGLQFRELVRGPDLVVHFADERLVYLGPSFLTTPLDMAAGRMEVAIFFTLSLLIMNRSSKGGAISQLSLELLQPVPNLRTKRKVGEESYQFQFRFETEEAVLAPLMISLGGNSSGTYRAKCAIIRTKISPGDSTPPDTDFTNCPIKVRTRYLSTNRNRLLSREGEKEFVGHRKATYNQTNIEDYRKFLMV